MVGTEQFTAILAFFFISWSYGFTVLGLSRAKPDKHPILAFLAELAIGFATFSILGVVLKLFHIPLVVPVYLILGAIYPAILLAQTLRGKGEKQERRTAWWKQEETIVLAILLLLLVGFFATFHKGAFAYQWLEDDDPWNHAQSAVYIGLEHTYDVDPAVRELNGGYANYLEPYPPTYGVLMGLLWQLNGDTLWTMKFFNVLMITLGLAFFYLMFREFFKESRRALLATIVLGALPAFMSHFIWSQTLALVIFPVAFFAFLKALDDRSWRIPAIIAIASMMVTQPVISMFFGFLIMLAVLFIFLHEHTANKGRFKKRYATAIEAFVLGAAGLAASLVYWGAQLVKLGASGIAGQKGGEFSAGWAGEYVLRSYSFHDIFFPPHSSGIDQAIGWGPIVCVMLIVSLVVIVFAARKTLHPKSSWTHLLALAYFALLAYLVFAPTFGLPSWGTHRLWPLLAIPLAMLIASGTGILAQSFTKNTYTRAGIIGVIALLIILTSWPAKAAVQTAQWPPGAQWTSPQVELQGYLTMQATLEKNSAVFPLCGGDQRAIGFNMLSFPWRPDVAQFRSRIPRITGDELVAFLERNGYGYITMDPTCTQAYGENATIALAQSLSETGRFQQYPITDPNGNPLPFVLAKLT